MARPTITSTMAAPTRPFTIGSPASLDSRSPRPVRRSGGDTRADENEGAVRLAGGGRQPARLLVDDGPPHALVLHPLEHEPAVRPLRVDDGRGPRPIDRAQDSLGHVHPDEGRDPGLLGARTLAVAEPRAFDHRV